MMSVVEPEKPVTRCLGEDNSRSRLPRTASHTSAPTAGRRDSDNAGVWFHTRAQQKLVVRARDGSIASPYGEAARKLHNRPRPNHVGYGNVVDFKLDVPAVMQKTLKTLRQKGQSSARPSADAARTSLTVKLSQLEAAHDRSEAGDGTAERDRVARLESQLTSCEALHWSTAAAPAQMSESPQHVTSAEGEISSAPHRHEVMSGTRRRYSVGVAPSVRVADLTKGWVHSEETSAAQTPSLGSVRGTVFAMPVFGLHPSLPSRPATDSSVKRLRQSRFRPVSAPSPPLQSRTTSEVEHTGEEQLEDPDWRIRLLSEPIQSYRILKDATEKPAKRIPSSKIPLLGSALCRRGNLERLRHSFEYEQCALHGALEDSLAWRDRCRSAVLRVKNAEGEAAKDDAPPRWASSSPAVCEALAVSAQRSSLLEDVFGKKKKDGDTRVARDVCRRSSSSHESVWLKEAAREAVKQEKTRIVSLLESFTVTCNAAALTLAATEELRADTIRCVCHPEEALTDCPASRRRPLLFFREHFLEFLRCRYHVDAASVFSGQTRGGGRASDIIDALPSQAEASFARYAYETLPSSQFRSS